MIVRLLDPVDPIDLDLMRQGPRHAQGPSRMGTHRGRRSGRTLGDRALARTYTDDGRQLRRQACHELALLAGTPAGPVMVRTTLTEMTRRSPYAAGLLSAVPDEQPEMVW